MTPNLRSEIKQTKPFGWKRTQGINRLEDIYRVFDKLMTTDGPINYEGHHTTLTDAWIGTAKANRPKLWGLGGGPRIIDLATSYGDGFCTMCPFVWSSPEKFAEERDTMRAQLARKGRDPEQFRFAVWFPVLLADDEDDLMAAISNPLLKWLSALFGRIDNTLWNDEGLPAPLEVPSTMHYQNRKISMGTVKGREYSRYVVDAQEVQRLLRAALNGSVCAKRG